MPIYCLIPPELAPKLAEPLRRHYAELDVEVLEERRSVERRSGRERRRKDKGPPEGVDERRLIKNKAGRRVGERRATLVPTEPPAPLPKKAQPHAAQIAFYEPIPIPEEREQDLDTARIVTRIQAGERDLFAALYERYFDRVYGYLLVVLREKRETEDATQQTFTNAFAALERYERRRQPFRAWLFRIAHNCAVDQLRRQGRFEPTDPETVNQWRELESGEAPPSTLGWITDHDLLLFIERLPMPQRQVLLLRFKADLTDVQIGEILGRNAADVRMLQARALQFLRERLTAVGRGTPRRGGIRMRRWPKEAPVLRSRRWALYA